MVDIDISPDFGPQLLRGRIRNLRKIRRNRDFVFTAADRAKMGATAITAGLAGLGGIATGLSGMAIDTTEEADLLEFDLDGKPVRVWVWKSVFNEGDEVEVVAEQAETHWQGYGLYRPGDAIVALHPHCSRGSYAHYRSAFRVYLKSMVPLLIVAFAIVAYQLHSVGVTVEEFIAGLPWLIAGALIASAICGVIAYRITRKLMGFVKLAEGIFEGFGWRNVKSIDLPAITKRSKKPGDPAALGVLYFRYSDAQQDKE
ncbi:putative type VI secretion system effector [Burkholderia orbicola]|uniref:putative type VI secretion system effector n=1 Tax=Burkholderia orbicola TaxID=2978683 RepID=UPI00264AB1A7|nr:putative type VI secretion system effector [Burkholderia orbicola]MDN7560433.1 putative type VI secretion system effector [Burkholderia orbicola]